MSYTDDFIKRVSVGAMQTQNDYGIPASVTIAQAALESSWGASTLTKKAKNYFGIRADKNYLKKGLPSFAIDTAEYIGGKKITDKKAPFRKYESYTDSLTDHANFLLNNSRYDKLFDYDTPEQWAKGLQKAGYSTSPTYADTLIKLIKKYDLKQYDTKAASQDNIYTGAKRVARRNKVLFFSAGILTLASLSYYGYNRYQKKKKS